MKTIYLDSDIILDVIFQKKLKLVPD